MNINFVLAAVIVTVLTACVSTPFAGSLSPQKANADAQQDITNQTLQICYAGTRATYPVGIPPEHLDLIKDLPRKPVPNGCTEPLANAAIKYSETYNKQILAFLIKSKKTEQGS